jgi:hypothetical protein
MASSLHVNGLATLYVGAMDALVTGNLLELGWTVDGVSIAESAAFEDVFSDRLGGHIPEDVQNFGAEAKITLDLIKYDLDILRAICTREYNGTVGLTPNAPATMGDLMVACEKMFSLYVKRSYGPDCRNPASDGFSSSSSGTPEGGWLYPRCYVMDERSFKVGTRVTRHNLVIRALPNASGYLFIENPSAS